MLFLISSLPSMLLTVAVLTSGLLAAIAEGTVLTGLVVLRDSAPAAPAASTASDVCGTSRPRRPQCLTPIAEEA